ncbi:MAG: hypothetical protein RIS84_1728 [Pseudomonadota bacterium]
MSLIRAFAGLRPQPEHTAAVLAPPYDVLSSDEARSMVANRPYSFLHISKPEIDLPPATDPYSSAVYAKGAENLQSLIAAHILKADAQPCYYLYALQMGAHRQIGLVAVANVADYDSNRIRKHELTRPDKEDDRVRQIDALNAQTGPVFLAYQQHTGLDELMARVCATKPEVDVTTPDGIIHQLWVIADAAELDYITQNFDQMPQLYIADGHHRSAAASRVAAQRRASNPHHTGEEAYNYFLVVIFPDNQLKILDYNRVIKDLNGLTAPEFLAKLSPAFSVTPSAEIVKPQQAGEFGMYLAGQWYCLKIQSSLIPSDPVASLDVSLLADNLIAPVLGITDQRRDKRIDFVGGIRGLGELEKRVNSGEMAVAFALHPTSMHALMAVADAGQIMPPKSTWFEPKLADGLVSHLL